MFRPRSLLIAVLFQILLGIFDAIAAVRILAAGSAGAAPIPGTETLGGPPFWAGIMFLILSVATLFSAYGLWIGQKWGKIVTIVTRVILLLFALGDVVNAVTISAYAYGAISAVYVMLSIAVVFLVLNRQPKLLAA